MDKLPFNLAASLIPGLQKLTGSPKVVKKLPSKTNPPKKKPNKNNKKQTTSLLTSHNFAICECDEKTVKRFAP